MMRRALTLCGALLVFAAIAAAQTPTDENVDPRPGLITADNPLYGLDVAFDSALVTVGLKKASEAVHERASEAVVAAEASDQEAVDRAVEDAHRMAQVAHGVNGGGLEDAEVLLREVRDRVPKEAYGGLDTAISEVMQAQDRLPTEIPAEPQVPDQLNIGGGQ